MASDIPSKICGQNRSKMIASRDELRFFDAISKRHGRFISDLVGLWGLLVPNSLTIFSRMRAPVRPLRHAEVLREIAHRSPRYTPRSLRRSATTEDIEAKSCGRREDCTINIFDEFCSHITKRSNLPAFRRASNQTPKPGLRKRAVNRLKWRRLTG